MCFTECNKALSSISRGFRPPDIKDVDDYIDQSNARTQADTYDNFIGAEVALPDPMAGKAMGRVIKRVRDNEGKSKGIESNNPLTNTSLYEVEFPDGHTEELQYNYIAENMMSQIDSEGHHYQLLEEISDHYSDATAITKRYY